MPKELYCPECKKIIYFAYQSEKDGFEIWKCVVCKKQIQLIAKEEE